MLIVYTDRLDYTGYLCFNALNGAPVTILR